MCFERTLPSKLKETVTAVTKSLFKVGDKVKVTRVAKDYEKGWTNVWVRAMNSAVGKIGKVMSVHSDETRLDIDGIGDNYFYPNFVLEPAEVKVPVAEVKAQVQGISAAVKSHSKVFAVASSIAIQLAKAQGQINADQVQEGLVKQGFTSADLGNAAGALFRGKNWRKLGTKKSVREGNHAREISTWQYIGA